MDKGARKHLPGQTQRRAARAGQRLRTDQTRPRPCRGASTARNQARQPVGTRALKRSGELVPAVSPAPSPVPGRWLSTGTAGTAGTAGTGAVRSGRSRGTARGLTQLAGGTVEARGADAGPGDGVALLGGSGTLADLGTALSEGPWQAGCRERGHQGDSDSPSRSYPTPLHKTFFPPFYFKPGLKKPLMTVTFLCHPKSKECHTQMVPQFQERLRLKRKLSTSRH